MAVSPMSDHTSNARSLAARCLLAVKMKEVVESVMGREEALRFAN